MPSGRCDPASGGSAASPLHLVISPLVCSTSGPQPSSLPTLSSHPLLSLEMAHFLRGKQAGIQNDLSDGLSPDLFVLDDVCISLPASADPQHRLCPEDIQS